MRNNTQQLGNHKRPGIDTPWDGPARVRRKKPKAAKPQPQLAFNFSTEISLQEPHAARV
jgi:hypothetical protein